MEKENTENSRNSIIKKSNDLVEAAYNLSLWEMRILIKMTSMVHFNDKDFKVYDIEVREIKDFFRVENEGSVYKYIKESVRSLMDKKVTIREKLENGKTKETIIPMVIEMSRVIEDTSSISVGFHPKMKPYLLDLKSRFLSYEVDNIIKLTSSHAIRIYELTKAYVGLGKRIISVNELKKMLGISDKYKQYSHLKQRILEPAKKNINAETDIIIDYKEIKEGRRVEKLNFTISRKKKDKATQSELDSLSKFGVKKLVIAKWREKYSEAHIQERVDYMLKQNEVNEIKNKAGYLATMMDKDLQPKSKMSKAEITKKVNAILFSRPALQKQIEAKHGSLSQEAINSIIKSQFPEKFN